MPIKSWVCENLWEIGILTSVEMNKSDGSQDQGLTSNFHGRKIRSLGWRDKKEQKRNPDKSRGELGVKESEVDECAVEKKEKRSRVKNLKSTRLWRAKGNRVESKLPISERDAIWYDSWAGNLDRSRRSKFGKKVNGLETDVRNLGEKVPRTDGICTQRV